MVLITNTKLQSLLLKFSNVSSNNDILNFQSINPKIIDINSDYNTFVFDKSRLNFDLNPLINTRYPNTLNKNTDTILFSKPTSKPTLEPTLEPTSKHTLEPTSKPTSKPALEPTSKPALEPTTSNPKLKHNLEPTSTQNNKKFTYPPLNKQFDKKHNTYRNSSNPPNTLPDNVLLTFLQKQNYNIIDILKKPTQDNYTYAIFCSLIPELYIEGYSNDKIRTLKLQTIDIFNKENLFRLGSYSKVNKADIDDHFSNSTKYITTPMLQVYSNVLDVNIILYDIPSNNLYAMNTINYNKMCIILVENDTTIYTIVNRVRAINLKPLLSSFINCNLDKLNKLKLEELQNIAKLTSCPIKKEGKNGKINLTKDELIKSISISMS